MKQISINIKLTLKTDKIIAMVGRRNTRISTGYIYKVEG